MAMQFNPKTGSRGIEWTDKTAGAIGGCIHDCQWRMPDGTIAVCYAKALAESGVAKKAYPHGFEHHYWRPKQLKELTAGDDPLLIFVDSMADLFAHNVPEKDVRTVLDAMHKAPHHAFQSLTKAAPQILKYIDALPPNLWVGVSSPPDHFMGKWLSRRQQAAMLEKSLAVLQQVKEKTGNIVWMSAEPVSWDLAEVIDPLAPLDWIVIGAASNGRAYFQPNENHVRHLLELLDFKQTPVFYKGNIKKLIDAGRLGRWREDFPALYFDGSTIPAVERRQSLCAKHGWTLSHTMRRRETADA